MNGDYALTDSAYSSKSIQAYDKRGIQDYDESREKNHILVNQDEEDFENDESFSDIDETMDRYKKRYELKQAGIDPRESREATRKAQGEKKKATRERSKSFKEDANDFNKNKQPASESMKEYELIRNDILRNEHDD